MRVTRNAYRLTEEGVLSRAQWNDTNQLIGVSSPVNLGPVAFNQAAGVLRAVRPKTREIGNDGVIPSPPVYTFELFNHRPGGGVDALFRDEPDPAADRLLANWQAAAPLRSPAAGNYVWAVRAPANAGRTELTLSSSPCGEPIQTTVSEALSGASIVVNAPADVSAFIAQGRTGRARFIARVPGGSVYFGVLHAE